MPPSTQRSVRARTSRTEQVQQQIKSLILERGLSAGEAMPTELELIDELDVSRNSLREALKALQAVGIVEIRHGFGMYVGRRSLDALVSELTFHGRMSTDAGRNDLKHLVQIREVLERGLLQQTIRLASPSTMDDLRAAVERMEAEADEGRVSPDADRNFHDMLYRPLANPLIDQLLGAFWDVHYALERDLAPVNEPAHTIAARHRQIFQAVLDRDLEAAIDAMNAHFEGIRARLDVLAQ